jgi:N-acetylglucosaminyldiphosphoundecaprenol N-acetyl-beta-D-mannosaminyltransferase
MQFPRPGIAIADLRFDVLDLPGAVAVIEQALASNVRGYVVTPNVDHLVQYRRDPAYRSACDAAALRLADGMPIVWASRLLGRPLPARVAGSDLLPALSEMAARRGDAIFLLGGADGVAERAAERLAARFPRLRIAGTWAPPAGFEPVGDAAEDAVRAVNAARPSVLFVGLGAPKQELWVHRYWDRLGTTVAVCCGAAIDFAAGTRARAPVWMQRTGLEWSWRLAREPGRLWKRYLVRDAAFVGIFLTEWWSVRSRTFGR